MEGMIANCLKWFLERNGLLHSAQCGFLSNPLTKECLLRFRHDLHEATSNKRFSFALFLNQEKAYDMVRRGVALIKMSNMGIRASDFTQNSLLNL